MQTFSSWFSRPNSALRLFAIATTLLAAGLLTWLSPNEKTLGTNAHLVYLHGAWVWSALLVFAGSAAAGAVGLITRRLPWHNWSLALGRSAMLFWLVTVPMSLLVMQLNWGGLYLDEPRWRMLVVFAVAGVLLQAALILFSSPWLASLVNLLFGTVLLIYTSQLTSVLHPDSPIASPQAGSIRFYFGAMLLLITLASLQLAAWLRSVERRHA